MQALFLKICTILRLFFQLMLYLNYGQVVKIHKRKGVFVIMQFAITAGFIVIDIFTGSLNAIKNKKWDSTVMREGLFHKMAFVIFIALACLCDYGQKFIDIGFAIPITETVLIYVILTELGSCIENLAGINPELIPAKLRSIFIKVKED